MDAVLGILVFTAGALCGALVVFPFATMAGRSKATAEWRDAIAVARRNATRD